MRSSLRAWLIAAFVLAAVSFYTMALGLDVPLLPTSLLPYYPAIYPIARIAGVVSLVLWVLCAIAAAFFLRWRAAWLLLSSPLVLWWPVAAYEIVAACSANVHACP